MKKILFFALFVAAVVLSFSIDVNAGIVTAMLFPAMGTDNMRILFNRINEEYKSYRIIPGYYVRSAQVIADTKTLYTFNVTDKSAVGYPAIEKYLSTNDRLIVTHVGFHIGMYVSTTPSLVRWHTYPSPFFASVTPSSFNYLHLMAIWQSGDLKLTVNNYEYLDRHALINHFKVPVRQYGETTAAISGPTTYTIGFDSYEPGDGFCEQTPNIVLNGSDDIKCQVEFTSFANIKIAHDGSNASNLLSVTFFGFLIKNAAPLRQRI